MFGEVGSVNLEEELELPVGDPLGVENDFDSLCVPGMILVRRVVVLSPGASDPGGNHTFAAAQ